VEQAFDALFIDRREGLVSERERGGRCGAEGGCSLLYVELWPT
jgi:hypothetical protein